MTEWKEYKLGEIATFGNGKVRPQKQGDIPIYGGNGILGYCDEYNYCGETIIVGRVGAYCGSVYYENRPIWVSDNALALKPKNNYNTKFIYYLLKKYNLNEYAEGSSHPLVTQTLLNAIEIIFTDDIEEQIRIASILSSLDDKIDLLHRENKTLETMAETLFRQWFIEEAKEDWKEGKLGDEFEFIMGQSPSGESFNEEGVGIPMYQGNADFGFRFPTRRVFTTQPTRFAEINDTLISVRAPVGAQNMATEKCCIGRGVAAFRYKDNSSFYSYTYYKLKSLLDDIKQYNDNGTVFGSISKSDFENIDIMIPDKDTILNFQKQVKPIDDKIINNNYEIQTLIQQRDSLLPKLMSNEINI